MKKVRIRFSAEIYFEGETIEDVAKQWVNTTLLSEDAISNHYADFLEIESVEDEDTGEDIGYEFDKVC